MLSETGVVLMAAFGALSLEYYSRTVVSLFAEDFKELGLSEDPKRPGRIVVRASLLKQNAPKGRPV
jgi:hypothetical protein